MTNVPPKKRLGELLVEAGIIDETQLRAALGHQRQWGVRLGHAVVDLKFATEQEVVRVLAKRFGFDVARLDQVEAYSHQQAVGLVPSDFAVKHNVFPLGADTSTLSVAMSDPSNLAVIDELRFRSGRRVKVSIGGDQEIATAILAAYPSPDGGVEAIALDIDEGAADGESVMEAFGGGSSEDFDSFFGADPVQPQLLVHGNEEEDPFSSGPAAAPVAVRAVPTSPLPAATHAPFPAPVAAQPAQAPAPAPARPRPVAQAPASAASRAPTAPATRAAPAPAQAPAARPAPVAPAAAPVAPTGPAARPAAPTHPRPGVPAPVPVPVPMIGDLELELPSREPQPRAQPGSTPAIAASPAPGAQARTVRPAAVAAPAPAPARAPRATPAPVRPTAAAPAQPAPAAASPAGQVAPLHLDVDEEPITGELTGELELPATGGAAGLSRAEQAVLAAIERLAEGGRAEPETVKPTQAIAVLIRLLVKKGVVTERELLDALRARDAD